MRTKEFYLTLASERGTKEAMDWVIQDLERMECEGWSNRAAWQVWILISNDKRRQDYYHALTRSMISGAPTELCDPNVIPTVRLRVADVVKYAFIGWLEKDARGLEHSREEGRQTIHALYQFALAWVDWLEIAEQLINAVETEDAYQRAQEGGT